MTSEKAPTALKTIGEVANDVDVATHVLRFWESKFHQIKPQKRRGRRYYRPEDVMVITQIKTLLYGQGYTIRGVQKFLSTEVKMKAADNNDNVVVHKPQAAAPVVQAKPAAPAVMPFALMQQTFQGAPSPYKPAPSPFDAPPRVAAPSVQSAPLANDDVATLKNIHQGLVSLREKLQQVA
jgi:DNA-binding transcriptional MerR regulator